MDTETTGLTATSRIVEIAVTTASGTVLLDTLINPGGEPIPAQATAIHGITDAMVKDAPTFSEVLPRLTEALAGRRIVIYKREYDTGRLEWELHLHHQALGTVDFTKHPRYSARRHAAAQAWPDPQEWEECAMEQYAAFYGDWHYHFGSYTWQKLGGGHRALSDARAVIRRLEEMATLPQPLRTCGGARCRVTPSGPRSLNSACGARDEHLRDRPGSGGFVVPPTGRAGVSVRCSMPSTFTSITPAQAVSARIPDPGGRDTGGVSRGLGRVQRAVLAYVRSEPGGLSGIDGTPLAASVTGLARVVYGVEQPTDAQRAAVRRAVRRLEAGGHVEVHRRPVGRTYTQQRAHPPHPALRRPISRFGQQSQIG
ncbi:3'-5' exonuclease [Streptomyces sp. NPDC054775]